MSVAYDSTIENKIIGLLDGWSIINPPTPTPTTVDDNTTTETTTETTTGETSNDVPAFITNLSDYQDNPNKEVTSTEVEAFYNQALVKAYTLTNRLNVNDLTSTEESFFIDGVCYLTASDLWNKYNIRVNTEDLEDTYIQSYGGLLYQQAIKTLNQFINQRIYTSTTIKAKEENQSNSDTTIWG